MADTPSGQPEGAGSAPAQTLSIPKERLDEVTNELRRVREELTIKDRLILESQQRMLQPQQSREAPELTPEETGLDPTTHAAVLKIASTIANRSIGREKAIFEQQIGMLAGRTEKAELIANRGAGKAKYLPEVERMQKEHFQRTGGFMPAELALDLLESKEKDAKIAALEARLAGKTATGQDPGPTTPTPSGGVPNAAATRDIPTGGGPGPGNTQKLFSQKSIAEMEADLEGRFASEGTL